MTFVDLLRATVLLCGGAATALGAACLVGATNDPASNVGPFAVGWWVVATIAGGWLGRRTSASPAIATALAQAKPATAMPEDRPGTVLLNRLWPLALCTVSAGALAFLAPQVPAIAAGFTLLWALSWRHQEQAVTAIEERDGVAFYVEKTSPVAGIALVRMPGLRREVPELPTPA